MRRARTAHAASFRTQHWGIYSFENLSVNRKENSIPTQISVHVPVNLHIIDVPSEFWLESHSAIPIWCVAVFKSAWLSFEYMLHYLGPKWEISFPPLALSPLRDWRDHFISRTVAASLILFFWFCSKFFSKPCCSSIAHSICRLGPAVEELIFL